jgi:hypothetical protein
VPIASSPACRRKFNQQKDLPMIAAIQALFRPRPNDASTRAAVMAAGMRLADAIRAREAYLESEGLMRTLSQTKVAHRALEQVAAAHGPALGFDVTPLSGGGRKD